jgi:mono/diheme cytochrome c family protein
MKTGLRLRQTISFGLMLVGISALVLAGGCERLNKESADSAQAAARSRGGAQLWAENCATCHNMRPPATYNDAQWAVSTHHMRTLGNLTGQEERAILQFLQSAN